MRKAIFITGAARGIGRATALLFAKKGWFVGAYDMDEAGLRDLAKAVDPDGRGGNAHTGRLDVTDPEAFSRTVAAFGEASGGRMDALFNNAGLMEMGYFEDIPVEKTRRMVDVNVMGVVHGILAALPLLEKTPGATIVSMSSASAVYGTPELAVYSATKFAVRAITEALDIEFRRKKVRVVDLMPSYVATDMVSEQRHRAKTLGTMGVKLRADDVAELAWKAVNVEDGWRKGIHFTAKRDIDLFLRLAGFQKIARPLMRRFSQM